MMENSCLTIDVSGILEKFNVYVSNNHTKDDKHQQIFLIGSYLHQNIKFLVIREKNFTLILC